MPAYNFGQHAQLSFSMWYKPLDGSGDNARLLEFGNGEGDNNIVLCKSGATNKLGFMTYRKSEGAAVSRQQNTPLDAWFVNEWRHVAWTMSATTGMESSHSMYIDGEFVASAILYHPDNIMLQKNYIGKSGWSDVGSTQAMMDTFEFYSVVLKPAQIATLIQVSLNHAAYDMYVRSGLPAQGCIRECIRLSRHLNSHGCGHMEARTHVQRDGQVVATGRCCCCVYE